MADSRRSGSEATTGHEKFYLGFLNMDIKLLIKKTIGSIYARRVGYQKKYLCGRWFSAENHYVGWNWVIQDAKNCLRQKVNLGCPFPVSSQIRVVGAERITFDPDDLNIFQHYGCYYQGKGVITIGKGTWIGPNVGIITANHDIENLDRHSLAHDVVIGEKCWIGMNCMILPGVVLGKRTIVGAGAVVTKSFPEGNCVIAGNPARIIHRIGEDNEAD